MIVSIISHSQILSTNNKCYLFWIRFFDDSHFFFERVFKFLGNYWLKNYYQDLMIHIFTQIIIQINHKRLKIVRKSYFRLVKTNPIQKFLNSKSRIEYRRIKTLHHFKFLNFWTEIRDQRHKIKRQKNKSEISNGSYIRKKLNLFVQ